MGYVSDENVLDKAIRLFIRTERLHRCVFDRKAVNFGLHRSQHRMLMHLSFKSCGVSQKKLADELEISPAAVAVALKKLEELDYITRCSFGGDSRVNNIMITDNGRQLTEESRKVFREIDKAMFEGVDDETLENFVACLEKMQENLKSM